MTPFSDLPQACQDVLAGDYDSDGRGESRRQGAVKQLTEPLDPRDIAERAAFWDWCQAREVGE